jgi:hypothetical protein
VSAAEDRSATGRRPLAVTPLWREVTARAGERCECTGDCGNGHTGGARKTGDGRCPHRLESGWRLFVVPTSLQPARTEAEVARLGSGELSALCGGCCDGRRRRAGLPAPKRPVARPDVQVPGQGDLLEALS